MKNLHRWLRISLAVILLMNVFFRYNAMLENFELRWVEGGWFSWLAAPFAIRLFIFTEAMMVVALLFGSSKKSLYGSLMLLLFYAVEMGWNANNLYTGDLPIFYFFSTTVSSILLLLLLGINVFLLFSKNQLQWRLKLVWQGVICLVFWISLFVLNPLEGKYFKLHTEPYEEGVSDWKPFFDKLYTQYPQLTDHYQLLLPFFSTHCEVCAWNAIVISAAVKFYKNANVVPIFFDSQDDIDHFVEYTQLELPYLVIPLEMAFNLVGDGFPAFVFLENGEVIKDLSPKQFNYAEIHAFFNQE
jgi:thiol-disulfide isomerase/thioredoxin